MGLFSSKSKSTSSVVNNAQNIGADGGSLVATDGATINVLDGGAVQGALDANRGVVSEALLYGGNVARDAFGFGGRAFDLVSEISNDAQRSLETGFDKSVALVSQIAAKQTLDSGERLQTVIQYFVIAVTVLGAIAAWRMRAS